MVRRTVLEDSEAPRAAVCGEVPASASLLAAWHLLARPPRMRYGPEQLAGDYPGPTFTVCGQRAARRDFELPNARGMPLACTLFEPASPGEERACVVFCHDGGGCRLSGFHLVPLLLPLDIGLLCFDFAGLGSGEEACASCGLYEQEDLGYVVEHLRHALGFARIGLWGETMGASAVILRAARDPGFAGVVLDGAFTDLWTLLDEVCKDTMGLPGWLVTPYLHTLRALVQRTANFDICDVAPRAHCRQCVVPALFLHGEADTFVKPSHSERLRRSYGGESSLLLMPGVEQGRPRPLEFLAKAAAFLVRCFGWERHLPATVGEETLAALHRGRVPYLSESLHGSLHSLPSLPALPPRSVLGLLGAPGVRSRCLGLVRAACEGCPSYRGARYLPALLPGTRTVSPYRTACCPVELWGSVSLLADDVQLALCWVREGEVGEARAAVHFALVSSTALSLARVQVVRGTLSPDASDRLSTEPAELLACASIDLVLGQEHSLRFEVSKEEAVVSLASGTELRASVPGRGPLHLWCFHWAKKAYDVADAPLGTWLELGGALQLPVSFGDEQALLDCELELPAVAPVELRPRPRAASRQRMEAQTQTTLPRAPPLLAGDVACPEACPGGTLGVESLGTAYSEGGACSSTEGASSTSLCSEAGLLDMEVPEDPEVPVPTTTTARPVPPIVGLDRAKPKSPACTLDELEPLDERVSLSQAGMPTLLKGLAESATGPKGCGIKEQAEAPKKGCSKGTPPASKGTPPAKGNGKGKAKSPGPGGKGGAKGVKGSAKGSTKQPRQPLVTPRVPLKRLFWTPISLDSAAEGTVWDRVQHLGADFDRDELEVLFAKDPGEHGSCGSRVSTPRRAPEPRRVLEEQRRRQVWCMLALLSDTAGVLKAVRALDDDALSPDKLDVLLANLPSAAEEKALRAAATEEGGVEALDAPEAFLVQLAQQPAYALRVKAMVFLSSFEAAFARLEAAERDSRAAGEFLRSSERITHLLAVILSVGNYLNGGTPRGRADGFELESLTKLADLKACQRGSLLDFIVSQMRRDHAGMLEEMFEPGRELDAVHKARRHKMTELQEDVCSLRGQAEQYLSEMEGCKDDADLDAPQQRLQTQLTRLRELEARFREWSTTYSGLCTWFHVGPQKAMATDEFFSLWHAFLSGVRDAHSRGTQAAKEKRQQQQRQGRPAGRSASAPLPRRRQSRCGGLDGPGLPPESAPAESQEARA